MLPPMTALTSYDTAMEADDTFTFPHLPPGYLAVVELSGSFGGASATLGYLDRSGEFAAFKDGTGADISTSVPTGWQVRIPISGTLAVTIAAIQGLASINLSATLCKP